MFPKRPQGSGIGKRYRRPVKYKATKDINSVRQTPGERVFQRSFYDHFVFNRDDYEILKYIAENPVRFKFDRFYAE